MQRVQTPESRARPGLCLSARSSVPKPVAAPARFDDPPLLAELLQDPLELTAAAMEGLEGLVHRAYLMVRLDSAQEKQQLLLQCLGGSGYHGGEGQLPRQLSEHKAQENRVVFQTAQVLPKGQSTVSPASI